jgi:hypothetical protein
VLGEVGMGAVLAAVSGGAEGVEIAFLDQAGERRRGPLSLLWNARFESMKPVREVVPELVEVEVAVPRLSPAVR